MTSAEHISEQRQPCPTEASAAQPVCLTQWERRQRLGLARLDQKLQILRDGFSNPAKYQIQNIIDDFRVPQAEGVQKMTNFLHGCGKLAALIDTNPVAKRLRERIQRDCEAELYCFNNLVTGKRERYKHIPGDFARLEAMALGEVSDESLLSDSSSSSSSGSSGPSSSQTLESSISSTELSLCLDIGPAMGSGSTDRGCCRLRGTNSCSRSACMEGREQPKLTQVGRRLTWAIERKGMLGVDSARQRYLKAMERQDWEK